MVGEASGPLLRVKRRVPAVRGDLVRRERLLSRLDADTRLILVVAPAGWGKTSLASHWASDTSGARLAWVSLDESDDEPVRFWSYVLTALWEVSEAVTRAPLDALLASSGGPMAHALPLLSNELAGSSDGHVLVLDDYHVIARPEIHENLEFLLAHAPANLRVVICSRTDPPLPLARMRVRGELDELRADDLRFSPHESGEMVSHVSESVMDARDAEAVWQRTEGWAAGLQLAGLALRGRRGGLPGTAGQDRHVFDYFEQEVLPGLAARHRELLVRAAPLELLSGDLCDAALEETGSAEVLAELERAGLFVVALDPQGRWYRCHRLLRTALLPAPHSPAHADVRGVLRRAARWFELEGRVDDAVRHLLDAGEVEAAADLLTTHLTWFLERGWSTTFLALGERLPAHVMNPQLALSLGYAAERSAHQAAVTHWFDTAEHLLGDDTVLNRWSSAQAGLLALRAVMDTPATDPDRSLALALEASRLEVAAGDAGCHDAAAAVGLAYGLAGHFEEAVDVLSASWRNRAQAGWSVERSLSVAGFLSLFLLALGREDDLDVLLAEARAPADTAVLEWGRPAAAHAIALLWLVEGRRAYQRADLPRARTQLESGLELAGFPARPTWVVLGLVFLADLELAEGDRPAARATLVRARELADTEAITPFVRSWLDAAEARLGRVAVKAATQDRSLLEALTEREMSILRMLPGTATQREIGEALNLSINTVKAYNKSVYRKLAVGSRHEAVQAARVLGLI